MWNFSPTSRAFTKFLQSTKKVSALSANPAESFRQKGFVSKEEKTSAALESLLSSFKFIDRVMRWYMPLWTLALSVVFRLYCAKKATTLPRHAMSRYWAQFGDEKILKSMNLNGHGGCLTINIIKANGQETGCNESDTTSVSRQHLH